MQPLDASKPTFGVTTLTLKGWIELTMSALINANWDASRRPDVCGSIGTAATKGVTCVPTAGKSWPGAIPKAGTLVLDIVPSRKKESAALWTTWISHWWNQKICTSFCRRGRNVCTMSRIANVGASSSLRVATTKCINLTGIVGCLPITLDGI